MNFIVNKIRQWLGIESDIQNISKDMHMLLKRLDNNALNMFELFHGLPFAAGILSLTAANAAKITQPGGGIEANSITAILTGILLNARQGNSVMEVVGELPEEVRKALVNRGFEVQDSESDKGKMTHILWT